MKKYRKTLTYVFIVLLLVSLIVVVSCAGSPHISAAGQDKEGIYFTIYSDDLLPVGMAQFGHYHKPSGDFTVDETHIIWRGFQTYHFASHPVKGGVYGCRIINNPGMEALVIAD